MGKYQDNIRLNRAQFVQKWHLGDTTNQAELQGNLEAALRGANAMRSPQPGLDTTKPTRVKTMANDAIIFAAVNPVSKIWPWHTKNASAVNRQRYASPGTRSSTSENDV